MVFKRKPKPRADPIAEKALAAVKEKGADERMALDAFADGQQAEKDGRDEDAVEAYLACADAWQRYHIATGIKVPVDAYLRLGVLLRRLKQDEAEIQVLESYIAHAGRDPDPRAQERLEKAYARMEPMDEFED